MSGGINLRDRRLEAARQRRAHYPDGVTVDHISDFWEFCKDMNWMRSVFGNWYATDLEDAGEAQHLNAVTVMPVPAYQKMISTPEEYYKTYWEIGCTWHDKYSGNYTHGRMFNEERLFGGQCETSLCHAIAFHDKMGDGRATEVAQYLEKFCINKWADRRMLAVVWKPHVMADASYTLGDSQQNIVAIPWTDLQPAFALNYAYTGLMDGKYILSRHEVGNEELARFIMLAFYSGVRHNPYIELQLHRRLTQADVAYTITLNELGSSYDA